MRITTGHYAAAGILSILCVAAIVLYAAINYGLEEPLPRWLLVLMFADIGAILFFVTKCHEE